MDQTSPTQDPNMEAPTTILSESPVEGFNKDRRMSDEWDASKVPPSRFQKRKGSIYATPSSRDGHVDRNYQDKYHAKIAEKYGGSRKETKESK